MRIKKYITKHCTTDDRGRRTIVPPGERWRERVRDVRRIRINIPSRTAQRVRACISVRKTCAHTHAHTRTHTHTHVHTHVVYETTSVVPRVAVTLHTVDRLFAIRTRGLYSHETRAGRILFYARKLRSYTFVRDR